MHPFPSLIEKQQEGGLSPLLPAPSSPAPNDAALTDSSSFSLRIKLNNSDYSINVSGATSVGLLKEWILDRHFAADPVPSARQDAYLRLIVRGRMMAPDSASLDAFNVAKEDVVHAVLAKETGRGAQARMLRRLNGNAADASANGPAANANAGNMNFLSLYSDPANSNSLNRLWRRIGIDASGVVIPRNEDDSSDESGDEEEGEAANSSGGGRRERRGFDRLRSTGMSRDEVNTIRLYFARSVDRYIERRRILIRASSQLRNSLGDENNPAIANNSGSGRGSRERSDTGDSTNSLLDDGGPESANSMDGSNNNQGNEVDVESGNTASSGASVTNTEATAEAATEGEEILLDRRRMEDEWMSAQGPYSEFRMNLNTSNPLLLAAISGNNPNISNLLPNTGSNNNRRGALAAGLFFRRNNNNNTNGSNANNPSLNLDSDDEDDLMFGSLGPNASLIRNNANYHPYMGPLPSAGTDKDFIWGFILGFFVGFIMLFWVWMPTVPHKQKIGIICGISFQLGLNLLRKGGEAGSVPI